MVAASVLVVLIGIIDCMTGVEFQVSILYLIPVALAAWFVSQWGGFAIAALSPVTSIVADYATGGLHVHPLVVVCNGLGLLGFFLLVAYLVAKIRLVLNRLDQTLGELNRELTQASQYVLSLLPEPFKDEDVSVDWRFIPSKALGGDSLGYHWIDHNHLAIYVIDVSGHGAEASLHSVSVTNVLRYQTLPDTDFLVPGAVMAGLNRMFPMEDYHGLYFTAWYGVYDKASSQLVYSSAGHPPAVMISQKGPENVETKLLQTPNIFIGALQDTEFGEDCCRFNESCSLYIFSDGVYEIAKKNGDMWTFREFVLFLTQDAKLGFSALDRLFRHVLEMTGRDALDDDFAIIEVLRECPKTHFNDRMNMTLSRP